MIAIDNKQVAVSHQENRTIYIVDVNSERLTKILSTDKGRDLLCRRKTYHIIFSVPYIGITRLYITQTTDTIINDETVSNDSNVVAGSDRICYTCPYAIHSVTVLDS